MGFIKALGLTIICLVIGILALIALPVLITLGIGLVIFTLGYVLYRFKDFDPEEDNPFK